MQLSLKRSVASLEDSIITISGPALAISGIIAGVDLVTGGNALKSISWLAVVWAITLLLTLDFQVLALGVRAHRAYTTPGSWQKKAVEIGLAVIVAAGISYVSIQMQSVIARTNAENISIDQAADQMGVNMVMLIWERSTLVLVLIFMSGWLREQDAGKTARPAQVVAVTQQGPTITAEQVDLILARLAKLDAIEAQLTRPMAAVQVQEQAVQLRIEAPEQAPEKLKQIDGQTRLGMIEQAMLDALQKATPEEQAELRQLSASQALPEFTATLQARYPQYARYITAERVARVLAVFQASKQEQTLTTPETELQNGPANEKQIDDKSGPIYPARFESAEARVTAALEGNPGASIEQIAEAAGCSERTAAKWVERLAQGQQAGK